MSSVVLSGNTSGAVTLSVPDVAGTNTITLPAQTGTAMVNGPAFFAYSSAGTAQSISQNVWTKVTFNTESFDTASCFASSRFTPTVTLSFWVYSSLTGTFGGALINGGFSRSYPFTYTISAANTWEQKTVTIAGDTTGTWSTDNSTGIVVSFSMGAGSSRLGTAGAWVAANNQGATGQTNIIATNGATFYITGVQLEVGSSATGFDYRIYSTELANCQRYYQQLTAPCLRGLVSSSQPTRMGCALATWMRSAPTVTQSGLSAFDGTVAANVTSIATNYSVPQAIELNLNTDGTMTTGRGCVVYQGAGYIDLIFSNNVMLCTPYQSTRKRSIYSATIKLTTIAAIFKAIQFYVISSSV